MNTDMNTNINLQELLVIFHNVLDTDTTEKLYKDNILPKKNYDKVINELNENIRKNPHKLTEEEKNILASEAEDMLSIYDEYHFTTNELEHIIKVKDYDFSEVSINASGVGVQILEMWEDYRMQEYEGNLEEDNYDHYKQLETIVEKINYI